MSKILITGGAGYIGSHVVRLLTSQGHEVIVLDNLTTGSKDNLPPHVQLIKADITSPDWTSQLESTRLDAVIHLAALTSAPESLKNPAKYKEVNEKGSASVWQFCQDHQISRILYASTAAVYGDLGINLASEDSPTNPLSPYGETKLAGEKSLLSICHNLHHYSLRIFNVGGGQDNRTLGEPTVLHALTRAKAHNKPLTIYGDDHNTKNGTPVRDFVHVEDVALAFAHFAVSDQPHPSGIYNIASGTGVSIKELARDIPTKIAPKRAGDISSSVADITKIKLLGWHPTKTLQDILT